MPRRDTILKHELATGRYSSPGDQLTPAIGRPDGSELLGHGPIVLLGVQPPILADRAFQHPVSRNGARLGLVHVLRRSTPRLALGNPAIFSLPNFQISFRTNSQVGSTNSDWILISGSEIYQEIGRSNVRRNP